MAQSSTPVLIVGAGPTGLILAYCLKKFGVDCRIIDKSSAPGLASRAIAVQARTVELYQQLGLSDELVQESLTAKELIVRRRGQEVGRLPFGAAGEGVSPFPYLLFYAQDTHEEMLSKHLQKMDVTVERNTELLSYIENENGITAQLKTPRGEEYVTAQYLCGCDGAHSAVRHQMGTGFPGGKYEQIFFVADVEAQGEMSNGGVQVSVDWAGFCIVMPIRQRGSVRLIGIVPSKIAARIEKGDKIKFDDIASEVKKSTGLNISKVNWFSTYNVHHRVSEHFRKNRAFIAGDAGHIHSPAGGQGMNTGLGDAINLAWKLAAVLQKRASEIILDTYEVERLEFAKTLVASTDRAFQLVAGRSLFNNLWRIYLLPLVVSYVFKFKRVAQAAFHVLSQIRIRYPHSKLSRGVAGEIRAGDRLPWVRTQETNGDSQHSDNFAVLKELDWQFHVYGTFKNETRTGLKALGFKLHEFAWNNDTAAKGFKKNALYFIRPDGYIGLAVHNQSVATVETYVAQYLLRPR